MWFYLFIFYFLSRHLPFSAFQASHFALPLKSSIPGRSERGRTSSRISLCALGVGNTYSFPEGYLALNYDKIEWFIFTAITYQPVVMKSAQGSMLEHY